MTDAITPEQALKNLIRGYVNLLETGRDRIIAAGGDCDPVEIMEVSDPYLKDARISLAQHQEPNKPNRETGWIAHRDQYSVPVLFNPYTGEPRDVRDVQSDPQGILIAPLGNVKMMAAHKVAQQAEPSTLPERDLSKPSEAQGLFRKFLIQRTNESGKVESEYFVLDLDRDPHAEAALQAYAMAHSKTDPQLSVSMTVRYGLSSETQQAETTTGVDKKLSKFCGCVGRGPDAPYPGMIEAFENHYGQSFTDKDWRNETGIWAAAWRLAIREKVEQTEQEPIGEVESAVVGCGGFHVRLAAGASMPKVGDHIYTVPKGVV